MKLKKRWLRPSGFTADEKTRIKKEQPPLNFRPHDTTKAGQQPLVLVCQTNPWRCPRSLRQIQAHHLSTNGFQAPPGGHAQRPLQKRSTNSPHKAITPNMSSGSNPKVSQIRKGISTTPRFPTTTLSYQQGNPAQKISERPCKTLRSDREKFPCLVASSLRVDGHQAKKRSKTTISL